MKLRKKRFLRALALYSTFMGIFMLFSIRVLGYSNPIAILKSMYATVESIGWNLFHDFDSSEEINNLPSSIKAFIPFDEWTILQTDTADIEESVSLQQKDLDHIIGLTDTSIQTIYLSSNDAEAHYAFYHEVGHVADYYNQWISQSEDFILLYQKESNHYADANYHQSPHYAVSSTYEFFASVFCDILLDNDENLDSVPETVQFIKENLSM